MASLAAAEGPGFMGAPTAGAADETTNDFELADAVAERVVSEIDYEAAATMAATKGVVGTVLSLRGYSADGSRRRRGRDADIPW